MTVGPQFLPEGATTPSSKSPFPIGTCIILRQKGNNGACTSQMPSIHSDQSEHQIRDVFMWFLLLNKEKSHHRGFCPFGWGMSFSEMLPLGSSLPFRVDLTFPPSQGRSHPFPITAGLGLPLKAFPGITIKYLSNYVYRLCQDTLSNPQSFFKIPTAISSQKLPNLRGVALYS